MGKHRTDQSAKPAEARVISAVGLKMIASQLVESIPTNLPEETAVWWTTAGNGHHLLTPEIQRVLWNPPTVENEAKHWSRFYQIMLGITVSFPRPTLGSLPADSWIFIPPMDPFGFEFVLQKRCAEFFPSFKMEMTIGTVGDITRLGGKYAINIRQEESNAFPISLKTGIEVTLAEILARELYFYFRGVRRPKNQWMYAMGSWFSDEKVPAVRWCSEGLVLSRFVRSNLKYHCWRGLSILD